LSNLTARLLSAAVMIPPVLWAFVQGAWWLRGLAIIVGAISLWEYTNVVSPRAPEGSGGRARDRWATIVIGLAALVASLVFEDATRALLTLQLGLVLLTSMFVLSPGDMPTAWKRLALLYFGVVYISLGLFSVVKLRDLGAPYSGSAAGAFLIIAMTSTWANDTCAYFAGRAFGKHKMAEHISPKKTWEGFAGGALGSLVFLIGGRLVFPSTFAPASWTDLVLIALPTAFFGPMGDLAESMWKRNFDTKDSSNIIPGHGGMLDRIDAVLFVAPYVLFYFTAIKPLLPALP
jgi:phosphatidate cytidylyltransferase